MSRDSNNTDKNRYGFTFSMRDCRYDPRTFATITIDVDDFEAISGAISAQIAMATQDGNAEMAQGWSRLLRRFVNDLDWPAVNWPAILSGEQQGQPSN
jgi:hypothetical protein